MKNKGKGAKLDICQRAMQNWCMITIDEILDRVRNLVTLSIRDPSAAAVGADQLRVETLRAISRGARDAAALAEAALRTVDQDVGGN